MRMQAVRQRFSFQTQAIFWISLCLRIFFLNHRNLQAEEAYYWNYSEHLDFGYLDHPPLVAVLIKLSTSLFGLSEFSVRFPALLCWGIASFFIYRWSELIYKESGRFALLLLSILPFFFIDSCIITPDMPMLAAWSAGLYFLYRALCLQEAKAWYAAGISIGLGLLAKYSIGLLVLTTGVLMLTNQAQRQWFWRKEPYYAACIAVLLFTPVLYWNSQHHWISFYFQGTRRLKGNIIFSLPELLGWLVLFLTPLGLMGLKKLYQCSGTPLMPMSHSLPADKPRDLETGRAVTFFLQMYTGVPILIYIVYSCFHGTKFNWVGPCLLALLPWLAFLMSQNVTLLRHWLQTSIVLLCAYTVVLICITYGRPEWLNQQFFTKMLSWQRLTSELYQIAANQHNTQPSPPVFLTLDLYGIASELNFYQAKQYQTNPQLKPFEVVNQGLMYDFWTSKATLTGKTILVFSQVKERFTKNELLKDSVALTPIQTIWALSQGKNEKTIPFYYQIVMIKTL